MNISEVKELISGASYEAKVEILERICELSGDCVENGYLGSSIANISYDEFGNVEFQSDFLGADFEIKSSGTVLENTVLIKQTRINAERKEFYLYSWDLNGTSYTYLVFDSEIVLDKAYSAMKAKNIGFLAKNIDNTLQSIGIAYRDILDVNGAISIFGKRQLQSEDGIEILDFEGAVLPIVS